MSRVERPSPSRAVFSRIGPCRSGLSLASLALLATLVAGCASGGPRAPRVTLDTGDFELLATASLPSDLEYESTRVGGLSGISWLGHGARYLAVSDDPSEHAPARAYELSIEITPDDPSALAVEFERVIYLTDESGEQFSRGTVDPEGLALGVDGGFWVSSEGNARARIAPFVMRYDDDGRVEQTLPVPEHYRPEPDVRGIRDNQAFESLTITPGGRYLVTATEGAIHGDGPAADVGVPTPARLLRYDLRAPAAPPEEYRYWAEPVARRPALPGAFRTAGLVEMLALDDDRLLALERSFGVGIGYVVTLWEAILGEPLSSPSTIGIADDETPVEKRLLLDFRDLGIAPRNLEGLTFGPPLADGRRRLVVVADNNFRDGDRTQILMLAVAP